MCAAAVGLPAVAATPAPPTTAPATRPATRPAELVYSFEDGKVAVFTAENVDDGPKVVSEKATEGRKSLAIEFTGSRPTLWANLERLRYLSDVMPPNVQTIYGDPSTIREHLARADLVVGAVRIPGAKAPRLVTMDHLKMMKNGSVIVDVAIDQGGCVETSKPTTHADPVYVVEGVVHYCVTNMPGAVGRTSTIALCNATLTCALKLASKGYKSAAAEDKGLAEGINMIDGQATNAAVAGAFGMPCKALSTQVDQLVALA